MKVLSIACAHFEAGKPGDEIDALIKEVNETIKDKPSVIRWLQTFDSVNGLIVLTAITMEKGND